MPPLRLLLVDDNPHDRALVAREMEQAFPDSVIHEAHDRESLDRLIQGQVFDLVITDYQLCWSDGIRILQAVKARHVDCPVIMFTGTGSEEVAVDAMKLGLDDYVIKAPSHMVRLRTAARSVVDRADSVQRYQSLELSLAKLLFRLKVGVFTCDRRGVVRSANRAFWQILLAGPPGTATDVTFRDFFHDPAFHDLWLSRLETADGPVEFLAELRNSQGETVWADVQLARSNNENGVLLEGLINDVTERTLAAETLRRQQAELSYLSRLTTMGELAAGLAHEVNQPLGAIANYAGACLPALQQADFAEVEKLREWVTQISEQAIRAGNIIRSIRRFLDRHETRCVRVPLQQVVDEALDLAQVEVQQSMTHVACQIPAVQVVIDQILIQQLFVNLIRNAIEAIQENPLDRRTIRIEATAEDESAIVRIHDQGPGIEEDVRETLFHPFVTSKPAGLGMGLAVCTRIVEAHRGRLTVHSDSTGSVFQFPLPLDVDPA